MNFLIIGMGNIGMRHIQGLSKLKYENINFYINDLNSEYKIRFKDEIDTLKKKFKFFEINNFEDLKDTYFDLIIVSTTATNRVEILENILSKLISKYIIIEKPICQSLSELNNLRKLDNNKIYVNFPSRYCDWYKKIKNKIIEIAKNNYLTITMSGGNIGLACNASHYIDLVYFWTNELPIKVDTSNLGMWHESKRKGFYDLYGNLKIHFKNHILELISYENSQEWIIQIFNSNKKFIASIDISRGIADFYDYEKIEGEIKLQSDSTNILYQQIVSNDLNICKLNIAIEEYELLLKALITNWNNHKNENIHKIMIT